MTATLVALSTSTMSRPSYAIYSCIGPFCTCKGDTDCNDMFTTVCKDTGSCKVDNNDNTTCSCVKKPSSEAPANKSKSPVAPVEGLKKSN